MSRASTSYSVIVSRLEKAVGGGFRGALLGHGHLQPLDFRRHQRDALGQFLDRQQRQILPDLMGDFLPRLVVVLDGHAFLLSPNRAVSTAQPDLAFLPWCVILCKFLSSWKSRCWRFGSAFW